MLIFSFELPPGAPRGPVVLVIIIEKENLDRMRKADPFDIKLRTMPTVRDSPSIRDMDIVIAYEEDLNLLIDFQKRQALGELIAWLERGRKIEKGDLSPPIPYPTTATVVQFNQE